MKITSVTIKNFKSIKDVTIPIQTYGSGNLKSNTTFLVGLNESGKSAILEAISLINVGFSEIKYEDYCFLESQENDSFIDIYADIEIGNHSFYRNYLNDLYKIKDFGGDLEITELQKNVYLNKEKGAGSIYNFDINEDFPYYKYAVDPNDKIIHISNFVGNEIAIINPENAVGLIPSPFQPLSEEKLLEILSEVLFDEFDNHMPIIQFWKSESKYLISEVIDLEIFKNNTKISIPLRNIFHFYGATTNAEIKNVIDRALASQARTDELEDKMSNQITKQINRIWKEHKIRLRVSINGKKCQVQIEEKDKKFTYFTMSQRSDGFKQFVSLILSLSAENDSNKLEGNIILIDEPEVHLHPSGVRYMRDEILKIGIKNDVIVSTHSHYMVDTNVPERHWIVQKEKAETNINQLNKDSNFDDDVVLSSAFGLNLFKELLPKYIIIVEGEDDKSVLLHALKILKPSFFCSIKSAGGASKTPAFARLLSEENIIPYVILDADKDGRDNKKSILTNQAAYYGEHNIFTLRDLLSSLPVDSTIEDLYPLAFVKSFLETHMNQSFELTDETSILHQIRTQSSVLKNDKQKLESLKMKLSLDFSKHYNEGNIEQCERLLKLTEEVIKRIEILNEIVTCQTSL